MSFSISNSVNTVDEEDMWISPSPRTKSSQMSQPEAMNISFGPEGLYDETQDEREWDTLLGELNDSVYDNPEPSQDTTPHTLIYDGVRINFPYKAYVSQEQMMQKIIHGVNNGFNCLLESPTGTGKTAALLCSLLAWRRWCFQGHNYARVVENVEKAESCGHCTCGTLADPDNQKTEIIKSKFGNKFKLRVMTCKTLPSEEDNTQLPKIKPGPCSPPKKSKVADDSASADVKDKLLTELCRHCIKKKFKDWQPPKIYYATRTHSQITQVIKQLKQTSYSDVKMTILGSREQTCINEKLKDDLQLELQNKEQSERCNINEKCRIMKRNYFINLKKKTEAAMQDKEVEVKDAKPKPLNKIVGNSSKEEKFEICPHFKHGGEFLTTYRALHDQAWDIEDAVKFGKKCGLCPYFGSMALHEDSEIIFCPYNYLIYPQIRDGTSVKLTNSIIVFDEAHNIEDICRDAASFCINNETLDLRVRMDFDYPLHGDRFNKIPESKRPAVEHFSFSLLTLSREILQSGKTISDSKNDTYQPLPYVSFLDKEIVSLFEKGGFGPQTLEKHREFFNILNDNNDEFEEPPSTQNNPQEPEQFKFKIASEGINFISELLRVLNFMFGDDLKNLKHFKVVCVNTGKMSSVKPPQPESNLVTVSHQTDQTEQRKNYLIEILCLNPALAFEPIKNAAHSIIVASGTLTPLISFSSELNTPFQVELSAGHVVSPDQVWAGVVKCGPSNSNVEFNLSKKFQDDPQIQDEIGDTILKICETVPHGVLVFLPSYGLMNTLQRRWSYFPSNNPLMNRLRNLKIVYFEEARNKEMFLKDMKSYKENVKSPNSNVSGCILFAVFRGKVSEGIDFADEQARAVITVGIPYSNCFAYEVVGKKSYNDARRKESSSSAGDNNGKNLLSGHEWYKVQAFRAMNQGFGRCIRHRNDWGAIIILESRLSIPENSKYLSKWLGQYLVTFEDFNSVKYSLETFVKRQADTSKEVPPMGQDNETTLLWNIDHYAPTQRVSTLQVKTSLATATSSTSTAISRPSSDEAIECLDASVFSIEDFDEDDLIAASLLEAEAVAVGRRQELQMNTDESAVSHSEGSELSYHSDTNAEADTSNEFIMGTP